MSSTGGKRRDAAASGSGAGSVILMACVDLTGMAPDVRSYAVLFIGSFPDGGGSNVIDGRLNSRFDRRSARG